MLAKRRGPREGAELGVRCFEDSGRGHKPRNTGALKAKKGKETTSLVPPKGTSPADTPMLACLRTYALQAVREYICVVLSHQVCGDLSHRPKETNKYTQFSHV